MGWAQKKEFIFKEGDGMPENDAVVANLLAKDEAGKARGVFVENMQVRRMDRVHTQNVVGAHQGLDRPSKGIDAGLVIGTVIALAHICVEGRHEQH